MVDTVLVIHGPNLNRLGKRSPELYGTKTLADIDAEVTSAGRRLEVNIDTYQSNHEGDLIDWLQARQDECVGIIVNPAGLTHYALAFRDALEDANVPVAVVHLTQLHAREDLITKPYRTHDLYADIAACYAAGFGWRGYLYALETICRLRTGL